MAKRVRVGEGESRKDEEDRSRDDPVSSSVLRERGVGDGADQRLGDKAGDCGGTVGKRAGKSVRCARMERFANGSNISNRGDRRGILTRSSQPHQASQLLTQP